jgi:methylated-DNA-protein-cysteine methyltransferase-like protein
MDKIKPTSSFYEQVYDLVRLIPPGRVTTYGAIAKAIGMVKSSRLVGNAVIVAHDPRLQIPVHRVVNSKGLLSGKHHYDTPNHMQMLLEAEGIIILDNQVQNLQSVFWNPISDL